MGFSRKLLDFWGCSGLLRCDMLTMFTGRPSLVSTALTAPVCKCNLPFDYSLFMREMRNEKNRLSDGIAVTMAPPTSSWSA